MILPLFQVDAFSATLFSGNPAAVVVLEKWLEDHLLQSIAAENNLSETAFVVKQSDQHYQLRWFTPTTEVNLCGHATLASAWVLFDSLSAEINTLHFDSASGPLTVTRNDNQLSMDFPSQPGRPFQGNTQTLLAALGLEHCVTVLQAEDVLVVLEKAEQVANLVVNFSPLANIDTRGVIVCAPGDDCDVVYRFFAPRYGINEDPVTGSAQCMLVPYWANALKKNTLHCRQISARGGELFCQWRGERITIAGQCSLYLRGHIHLPTASTEAR